MIGAIEMQRGGKSRPGCDLFQETATLGQQEFGMSQSPFRQELQGGSTAMHEKKPPQCGKRYPGRPGNLLHGDFLLKMLENECLSKRKRERHGHISGRMFPHQAEQQSKRK